jgi:hypothetical protein
VGSELSYDELRRLEAHEWVWKETLRLYPVAMGFPRIALRDTELGVLSKVRIRLVRDYEGRHQIRPIGGVSGAVDLVLEPL